MDKLKKLLESVGISEEHQTLLGEGIKEIIKSSVDEEVSKRVAVKEDELVKKLTESSEAFIEEQLSERIAEKEKELEEKAMEEKVQFEEKMVNYLDMFLENEINANISDEVVEKVALKEVFEPIVTGIKALYEENGLFIESSDEKIVENLQKQVDEYKTKLADKINENVELAQIGEQAAAKLKLISLTAFLHISKIFWNHPKKMKMLSKRMLCMKL